MFKTFTNWIGNLLAVVAIGLLLYHRLETVAMAVTLLLALGYVGGAVLSKKSASLYPGSILFSIGCVLAIKIVAAPNAFLLLGLPLVLLLFGLGQILKRLPGEDFRKPLDIAGHLSVFLLLGLIFPREVNYSLVIVSLAIYSGLYLILFFLTKERWYLLPGAIVIASVYYFFLKGTPSLSPTALLSYFVVIGVAYAMVGFFLTKGGKAQQAIPIYTAAVILLLGTTGLTLIGGGFKGEGSIFVFLISALAYGLMLLFTRRDEFIYLITLSLGLLVYNLIKVSGDKFSLELISILPYALVVLGILLLYPLIRHLLLYTKPFSLLIIRNWKGAVVYGLPVAGLLALILLLYGAESTKSPYFCGTCHETEPQFKPQYENWQTSVHKKVSCVKCHYPPGIEGVVRGKIDGIRHTALFITKSYPPVLHARIDDRSCLRSGCHSKGALNKPMVFEEKIKFNHEVHLSEEVRGMKLPCTTCHAHTVEGEHFEVEKSACFTCHLQKPGEKGTAIGSCLSCHNLPGKTMALHDSKFVHTEFFEGKKEKDIDCMQCHSEVTRGKGEASSQRCISCHDVKFEVNNVDELHRFHLEKKKVDCFECHTPIEHGTIRKMADLAPECTTCHRSSGHSVSEGLYIGKGGVGVKDIPSPMYLANVDCQGCHRYDDKTVPSAPGKLKKAGWESCISCHEEFFGEVLDSWKKDTAETMDDVKAVFTAIEEKLQLLKGKADEIILREAKELYERAKANYGLVREDGSYGAHNKDYADSLLGKAKEDAQASLKLLEKEEHKPGIE